MKKDIHPKVYTDAVVTCACGNTFVTMSTQKTIVVEICSACHPFFTGQQRFVDTEGRVAKFAKKVKNAQAKKAVVISKKASKAHKNDPKENLSLKDLLQKTKKAE